MKQVTRGHNIVADGWAGASNPQPHANLTHSCHPLTHPYTHNNNCSIINTRFSRFKLKRDGPTDGPMDRRTDKASYRVAYPQLKISFIR